MHKKLYRIRQSRVFGGVCTGLGEYFDVDPVLVRVAFVIFALLHGFGILLYIILWIIIPEKPFPSNYNEQENNYTQTEQQGTRSAESSGSGRIIAGIFLITIGLLFFAERFLPYVGIQEIISLGLIVTGAIILWEAFRGEK